MSAASRLTGWFRKAPTVLRAGHPSLRVKAEPIKVEDIPTQKIQRVIREMKGVFSSPYTPVVGLAAPQIGHPIRLIAYRLEDKKLLEERRIDPVPLTFLINPTLLITDKDPETKWSAEYESCESVPNYNALVKRAGHVKVEALDLKGNKVSFSTGGFLARLLQHEMDHLDGVLFTDRMDCKSFRHDKYIDKYELYTGR
ncbi:peptide deformylase [Spizellomyces punctatus DAOM BR117]|uniref:Peptide deformylase n=1 Tax=Spizellomyces punctatus (strain DAOM BR117) TaxID=645134 RepID=A0A0L0HKX6_SPIPD|nr:peptide deformylase [Spizellomyces punctatus DAOM BR117]KND01489.1 peptide deformylase [Spizellomyces punctatus DAOM BR117]|eukprot:XP_016609528.1 peptide deformylase [Spizellomyces punctatus DAOM BR117]